MKSNGERVKEIIEGCVELLSTLTGHEAAMLWALINLSLENQEKILTEGALIAWMQLPGSKEYLLEAAKRARIAARDRAIETDARKVN